GDDLKFPGGGSVDSTSFNNTNNLGSPEAPVFFHSIEFQGTGYTLAGNRILLGDGGIISAANVTNTISSDITLNPSRSPMDVDAGATLTLSGIIDGGASGGLGIFFDKLGDGKAVLAGANSYTTLTRILAGTLNIRNSSALGTASAGAGDETSVFA